MALTAGKKMQSREGKGHSDPVAAATTIFIGALVVLNAAGNAAPGSVATGLIVRGVAVKEALNGSGAAGDVRVETRTGCFKFKNSASTDAITRAEIGDDCYIVDDETVAKTNGTNTRSVAGKIDDVEADGVWVKVGI